MNSAMLLKPAPYTEAIDFLKSKPVVARKVFDQLVPEIQARAFTVAGLEVADDLRLVRDEIARLPQGAVWNEVRDNVLARLMNASSWIGDADSVGATRHAELLLRMNGFMAYAAADDRLAQDTKADFPYAMYNSMEDARVRPTHAALDGLVLPVDDPWWATHTPPWDWGCRCWKRQISAGEHADISSGKSYGRVLGAAEYKRLTTTGELDDGAGHVITITTPQQNAIAAGEDPATAWHWNPGDLRIPLDSLAARYADDKAAWDYFVDFAKAQRLTGKISVWDWLKGQQV